ncbi:MAG: hypothetical protein IKK63_01890 [Clostridia bacterium]|nr:hypothetical protein [Clostridia bacterium]MBR3819900.1 hypothetical protein [Clostridia bacterium]
MEQFKLKSIDELDLEFVSATRGQNQPVNKEPASLIPEISKTENKPKPEDTIGEHYFKKPVAVPVQDNPIYSPMGEPEKKKPRPLVPIGQKPSPYVPVGAKAEKEQTEEEILDFSDANYGEAKIEDQSKKTKKNGGVLAGKIISIVMLCVTVVTFILGCFVTIFLDNSGTDIGGLCFNTMSHDIENLEVSEGDLIISKKCDVTEYTPGDYISVPASGLSGCDIQVLTSVSVYSEDNASLSVTPVSSSGYPYTLPSASSFGVVVRFIPALGGILRFAMDNAILVCILFVLLSAFWCLILVLMERSSKADSSNKKARTAK